MHINFKFDLNKRGWLWASIAMVVGATFTTFMVQYLLLDSELFQKTSDSKWFLNVLCVLVVYLIMLCMTNKVNLSIIFSHIFFLVLAFVNYFVYLFRGNEFYFSDLRAIGTGLSVASKYKIELNGKCWIVIVASLVFCVLGSLLKISFKKVVALRLLSGLSAVLAAVIIVLNAYDINTETWEQKGTYRNGYVLNFVLSIRDSFRPAPADYRVENIAELENKYGKVKENTSVEALEKKPTIIVIMSESYADLRVVGEFQTNAPITPFYDSLVENTLKGYALCSVYGAKTPNSEWEFLTGNSMAFMPQGSVVYQQYMNETPTSLVSTLKTEGYTCVAMHPYYKEGWSRETVYPKLGFDETYFLDDFDQTQLVREYISDRALYTKIFERFEEKKEKEDLYLMAVTMQNHGGYTKDYDNFTENYYKIGRSYTDANQYFSLLKESDDALRELITYFSEVKEPVQIVFFGDHQPGLNREFIKILNGKGLSGLSLKEVQDLYTVPFFIWTNYDTTEQTIEVTSLNYLSTMALERAGIDLPPYHQFLADLREVIPAINARGYYSEKAQGYVHVDKANGEEKKWLALYENLQYNGIFDSKNTSEVFFPYMEEKKE